ncbi:uncharacterized protein CYBJADRAFT_66555 [Cyberlindnera jadinii NRRL Y-1542]|uniref:Uncharacterized protein n=1 Tax=Cyberlindnera jadinii (strain ATCC 18201 / CBS 1600 / BCRC 20928 / JCM 3617 / NBRC 0987 / NRRL Y-1542) TaxID=983966 RepID=A0A1E4S655_CYBJN|nr:hypothetical protein CYBJADRAFT_66555 [Cyberlindnera jadinii NRRL Y-1542]ODV74950.1 hypothetical protein CYBJADRAFT_66555 [Cyberlindnera jadinii NRRL Y-1542]
MLGLGGCPKGQMRVFFPYKLLLCYCFFYFILSCFILLRLLEKCVFSFVYRDQRGLSCSLWGSVD